ncbi:unnamed protein product [Closterium sp. NIES-65]|nr:unnamed protein product [Closterium sp. NIES-65]
MNRSSALSSYGQNLLSTFGIGQWAPSEVVNVWLDEKKFYTYSPLPGGCKAGHFCSHYVQCLRFFLYQIVARKTTVVGCSSYTFAQSDLLLPEFFLEGFVANIRESESQAASMGPQGPESTDSVLPPTTELSAPPPDISPGATNKKKRRLKVKLPAIKDVPWKGMFLYAMEWMSNPINAASFFWCVLATFAFVIVVMCELGLMKNYIHDHETLEEVKEVSTQILNALFVLMCLIWHPVFMRDVLLLIRWKPKDKWEIRAEYCKDGKRKPNDRTHMAFVVFWLQLTCWATYAFAAVFLVYPMGERPMSLIIVTTVVSFAAPAFAFLHLLLSPLSKDYDIVRVGEGDGAKVQMFQRSATFMVSHTKVEDAQWAGSVLSDPEKRQIYDQYGEEGLKGQAAPGGGSYSSHGGHSHGNFRFNPRSAEDIFAEVFGGHSPFGGAYGPGFGGMGGMGGMPSGRFSRMGSANVSVQVDSRPEDGNQTGFWENLTMLSE